MSYNSSDFFGFLSKCPIFNKSVRRNKGRRHLRIENRRLRRALSQYYRVLRAFHYAVFNDLLSEQPPMIRPWKNVKQ